MNQLVDEALNGKKPVYTGTKMLYDENGHRIGLTNFQKVQIETLGYMSLGDKVTRILEGSMDFHAKEDELEYDQEEGTWLDEDPDIDPTNDFLDKTDVHDIHKELIEKQREVQQKLSSVTKVEPGDIPSESSGASSNGGVTEKNSPDNGTESKKSSNE